MTGGGATGGSVANEPLTAPKPGQFPGSGAGAGAEEGGLSTVPKNVPGGIVRGAVEGAEAGGAIRAVLQGGLRFLGGVAVGAAVGLIAGLAVSYLTRELIEADITSVLQNVPDDKAKRIQARIDALPAGKKRLARVTLEYTMWRSTLGFLGAPDAYQMKSMWLVNVHPGNEELDFPSSTEEKLGETALLSRKITVRISYTVSID